MSALLVNRPKKGLKNGLKFREIMVAEPLAEGKLSP
jgi:hypothetical protein